MRLIKAEIVIEDEGVGARAKRPIPGKYGHLDPFVLFDDYEVDTSAYFPMHPHGGFEGFQVLREGRTRYEDNMGNIGHIGPGDVRRFVAGSGFHHSETPEYNGTTKGYLLWIKLPSDLKGTNIIFKEEGKDSIPVRKEGGLKIITILGGVSPVGSFSPVLWEIINSDSRSKYSFEMGEEENAFFYVTNGSIHFDGDKYGAGTCLIIEGVGSSDLLIDEGSEVVFIKGRQLHEDIVQDGHFVL